ncbi:spherulation-specific family 4 protein [Streptomyces sp.]|uniref:spherulation-specific family 4 protein n=1 Tax=Streptomyces sp. TaxID=1931 RepID=UPI0028126856|nr:spherulation-specific family 4 protein [Streptomyces sp.]
MSTLLVPYYEHPAARPAEWDAIVAAAPRLYGVVLNPADGPGDHPDPAFAEVAGRLRAAGAPPSGGVRVLGYADTGYGRRAATDVVRDLTRHRDWYGTDGAFLDQVPSGPGEFAHYRWLAEAARAAGCGTLVLNHGTAPHPCYAGVADLLVTFEGPWESYLTPPAQPWPAVPDGPQCHLLYDVPPGADPAGLARARGAMVYCAVPGTGDHPWGTLPYTLENTS